MSEATQQVAADLTAGILGEAMANGLVEPPAPVVVAPPVTPVASAPAETVAAPAAEATQEAPAVPVVDFSPKLSDDLQALLDEPDFDEEAELELEESEGTEYEYLDPEVAKKLKAAEKRTAFLEAQLAKANKKKWVDENLRAYPLLAQYAPNQLKAIDATSRRGFAREAAKLNDTFMQVAGPLLADLKKASDNLADGAVTVARAEVANAWGNPASDTLPAVEQAKQQALVEARKKGLGASLRELLK